MSAAHSETPAINLERYQRQMQVTQLGKQGQKKLANSHVAIVGMGGLGAPASLYLVGAGVGKLTFIDHDTVSLTNLHRQVLYRESDIGDFKAEVAKRTLWQMNSDINIISHTQRLTASNIQSMLAGVDVVVDAADNFALSYLLSDYCKANHLPLVSASVMDVTGYVGLYCQATHSHNLAQPQACPSMRAVFPNPPPAGQDCNSVGVIGTSAGMMGVLQAQEVIKVILGDKHQLAGRLLSLDLWTYRQTTIDFNGADEPDNYVTIISEHDINEHDWVVDVRNPHEVEAQPKQCHQHTPVGEFTTAYLNRLPRDKRLVFTCASGARALTIADRALAQGFDNVAVWL